MQFKQAQIDKYLKKPDDVLRCAVIYGSNEGLQAEYVKKFTTAVCPDPYDPFRVVYLNGSDVNGDPGILFGEYNGQSLMGGRRVVIVRDGDNNLTKHVKALLENNVSDTLLIVSSGSLNKKSSLVRLAEENENMAAIACYEDRDEDIFNSTRAKFIENGITIGNEALQLLCARLSNDRMSNSGEIEKLITYLGDHKNVTVEDVQKIISDASSSSGDDVCFAAAGGYADKALAAFNKLVNEGNEPISIIRSLTYHFNKILTCKAFMENGDTVDKAVFKLQPRIIFFANRVLNGRSAFGRERNCSACWSFSTSANVTARRPICRLWRLCLIRLCRFRPRRENLHKVIFRIFHVSNPAGVKRSVSKRRFLFGSGKGFSKTRFCSRRYSFSISGATLPVRLK